MNSLKKFAAQGIFATGLALVSIGTAFAGPPPPSLSVGGAPNSDSNLNSIFQGTVSTITDMVIYVAGAIALIYLIWAGIKYITAGGDTKKAADARQAIINAVIGIVIIVGAYTIINIAFAAGNSASTASQGGSGF